MVHRRDQVSHYLQMSDLYNTDIERDVDHSPLVKVLMYAPLKFLNCAMHKIPKLHNSRYFCLVLAPTVHINFTWNTSCLRYHDGSWTPLSTLSNITSISSFTMSIQWAWLRDWVGLDICYGCFGWGCVGCLGICCCCGWSKLGRSTSVLSDARWHWLEDLSLPLSSQFTLRISARSWSILAVDRPDFACTELFSYWSFLFIAKRGTFSVLRRLNSVKETSWTAPGFS